MKNCLWSLKWKHGKFWSHGPAVCLDFCVHIGRKRYFLHLHLLCKALWWWRGVRSGLVVGPTQCHTPGVAQRQLRTLLPAGGGSTWQWELRQTLLGQPRPQLHVQPSPTDSQCGVWGELFLSVWASSLCPSSLRWAWQVTISLKRIPAVFRA